MNFTMVLLIFFSNFYVFLTINLFLNTFSCCLSKKQQYPLAIIFLVLTETTAFIPQFFLSPFIFLLCDLMYTLLICKGTLRAKLKVYLKYECYYIICSAVIAFLHTLCTQDSIIYTTNKLYAQYTYVIGNFMLYVILSMYIILKKLSNFPAGKIYKRYFLITTGLSVVLLIVCSMMLGSTIINQEDIVPILFSVLLLLVMLYISIYKKISSVLEENALAKIELEKNALAQDYYTQVQESLKTLSLLRHDFKNHLAVLQGYASMGQTAELQNYIQKISNILAPVTLITTPSQLLSAIINAKNEECKAKGISFIFEQQITDIYLDEFHTITIFSNMLDNAILAASKCNPGTVHLSLSTVDSYLSINCVNNHREQIEERAGHFLTTKTAHRELHGLGIHSMRKAVRELHGEITINHTADSFHVNILLPNYP